MRRSASASIVSDKLSAKAPSPSPSPSPPQFKSDTDSDDAQLLLPRYDPNSHPGKKDRSRLRSAENAIHFVPLVLILCAVILWMFSNRVVVAMTQNSDDGRRQSFDDSKNR